MNVQKDHHAVNLNNVANLSHAANLSMQQIGAVNGGGEQPHQCLIARRSPCSKYDPCSK